MSKWRNGIRAGLRNQFFCGFKSHLGYQRQHKNCHICSCGEIGRHIQDVYFAGSSPAESTSVRQYDNLPSYASVAESADAPDLKSGVRDGVRVQFPSEAPCRGVAQLVEQRSPKPRCVCSNRITPAICEWSRTVRVRTANPSKAGSTPVVRSKSALCISTQGRFLFFVRLRLRLVQKRLNLSVCYCII